MVKEYLDELRRIIDKALPSVDDLECKHLFSGAAVYVNGKIFCSHTPVGIAVKLPEDEIVNLIASKRGTELRYFPRAPIKKDYVVLGSQIVKNLDELYYWIGRAVDFTTSRY